MKRGEVWWVNFEPSIGGETRKRRPAIIISNDTANRYLNRVQVIPLTSNTDRVYPSEALVKVNDREGKAMADQVMTVSKERLIESIGAIRRDDMLNVERALKIQLGIS